jgi:metal-responsive CopG/Arc/MetJ family transcriptional regulator
MCGSRIPICGKRNRRSSISLPKQQTSVTKKAEFGYTSRSEFIKEAVTPKNKEHRKPDTRKGKKNLILLFLLIIDSSQREETVTAKNFKVT